MKSCCRLASLLDLSLVRAAEQVVPVSATAAESVQRLRPRAAAACLDAASGGLYAPCTGAGGESAGPARPCAASIAAAAAAATEGRSLAAAAVPDSSHHYMQTNERSIP